MNKTTIPIILAIILQTNVYAINTNFKDIKPTDWYSTPIIRVAKQGYINGYEDNTFKPDKNMTVREFMVILDKYIKAKPLKDRTQEEVKIELLDIDWGYKETQNVLKKLYKKKIDQFNTKNLDREITREEVVFLIANSLQYENKEYRTNIKDIQNSQYKPEIQIMLNKKIINGYQDNTFRPKKKITRAEVVIIIDNLIQQGGKQ